MYKELHEKINREDAIEDVPEDGHEKMGKRRYTRRYWNGIGLRRKDTPGRFGWKAQKDAALITVRECDHSAQTNRLVGCQTVRRSSGLSRRPFALKVRSKVGAFELPSAGKRPTFFWI